MIPSIHSLGMPLAPMVAPANAAAMASTVSMSPPQSNPASKETRRMPRRGVALRPTASHRILGRALQVPPDSECDRANPGIMNGDSLPPRLRDAIAAAIRQEIVAQSQSASSTWLDIDAIEGMADVPGKFVYRLVLSNPVHFSADQAISFQIRNPRETITAIVIHANDEGVVVECEKALPTDAKLLSVSFDPGFILRALAAFIEEHAATVSPVSGLVLRGQVSELPDVASVPLAGLNHDQSQAVAEMTRMPLHLLWGPPGTGKTTTLGVAISQWLRNRQTVLVVSTSNAAVDVAMRAVLAKTNPPDRKRILRLGASLDSVVSKITEGGRILDGNIALARQVAQAQERLRRIADRIAERNLSSEQLEVLFRERVRCEGMLREFHKAVAKAAPAASSEALVIGCTLARMVLDKELRERRFDVVVVDEVSMVSLLYAVAASMLAKSHIVYAGDPQQLPPIAQSKASDAQKWFGQNVYDWFEVQMGVAADARRLRLLRTQYRMTNEIGDVVSRLTYDGLLQHGRNTSGSAIEFVEIPAEWQTTHYSVRDKSYYHLAIVPILHALAPLLNHDELLLLTPFRPQRSMLTALSFDLKGQTGGRRISASTIHRAQGSEARTVVVDLTAHAPDHPVAFFRDKDCAKLLNVALSRARDQLILIGSRPLLDALAATLPFWQRVVRELGHGIRPLPVAEVLEDVDVVDSLAQSAFPGHKTSPAIYSHAAGLADLPGVANALATVNASRKLLVVPDAADTLPEGDFIVRRASGAPPVFLAGGTVCLPLDGRWLVVDSPNVSRVIWRIGFSHLADDAVDPNQAKRFFCPECATGDLVMKRTREGWFLTCTNSQVHQCNYSRRLSLEDAKLKVRLQDMTCPRGHPLTVRESSRSFFLGCENYPECDHSDSLSLLDGM